MKFNYLIFLVALLLFLFASCDGDFDIGPNNAPDYIVQIMSPTNEDKNVNDSIHVHVIFDEPTNRRLHHANVKITSNVDGTVIFDGPTEANVDAESGDYELHEDVHLAVVPNTDWTVTAKAWGIDEGLDEVTQTVEFHVHPE